MSQSHSTTKYNKKWEDEYSFLRRGSSDETAKCTFCNAEFKIDSRGIGQVKSHAKGKKHTEKEKILTGTSKQRKFVISGENNSVTLGDKNGPIRLTHSDELLNAEIIQALKFVQSNYSFSSASDDSDRFKLMFPDSDIAKSYQQGETKIKYVIQYGIAPFIVDRNKNAVKDIPFVFKFDETTNSQVKKQYDAYVQFWSDAESRITSIYIGSLFVGHCGSIDLLNHFYKMITDFKLKQTLLLHISMDGPNVNTKFERELLKDYQEQNKEKQFFIIDTCSLHKVHTAFRKGLNAFDFDIEDFVFDVSFFFKHSACRREDYISLEMITDLSARFAVRHVSSRWLSLRKACLRLLEQWPNLRQYFLQFLPTQKQFNVSIKKTARYERISGKLQDPLCKASLCFIVFISDDFEQYLTQFQRSEPMIHVQHPCMISLVHSLMTKFFKKSALKSLTSDGTVDCERLISVDVENSTRKLMKIDVGTRAKEVLSDSVSIDDQKLWRKKILDFYVKSSKYLQKNLPLNNSTLKNATCLQPGRRQDDQSLVAISRLALTTATILNDHACDVFKLEKSACTPADVCDRVRKQWQLYQLEDIPKSWTEPDPAPCASYDTGRAQESYWRDAYSHWSDMEPNNESKTVRIDDYWSKVFELKDSFGKRKYPQLEGVVKCVLTLSHGNAEPERGFSMNRAILETRGASLHNDTLIALRHIKGALLSLKSVSEFDLNEKLRCSVRQARQRYELDLISKRKVSTVEIPATPSGEIPKEVERVPDDKEKIHELELGIQVAETAIESGNQEIRALLTKVPLDKDKLQAASSQIEMGVNRKKMLCEELEKLKKLKK